MCDRLIPGLADPHSRLSTSKCLMVIHFQHGPHLLVLTIVAALLRTCSSVIAPVSDSIFGFLVS